MLIHVEQIGGYCDFCAYSNHKGQFPLFDHVQGPLGIAIGARFLVIWDHDWGS
jgi:hypothetical protein